MDTNQPLILRREGGVAHLRFNRPQSLNAIDSATAKALRAASEELARDPTVRAVVLSGEGKGFMAGGDIGQMKTDPRSIPTQLIDPLHAALRRLAALDAPVIASVHGVVAGAGVSMMLAADLAIAAEGTRFVLAYLNLGASCDGGASFALPRVVGLRKALEIALLNETFDAAEALRLGLVNRVVPAATLEAETDKLAQRLAAGPTRAIGRMRRLMRRSSSSDFGAQLDAEKEAFAASTTTRDFAEGVSAFLEKRAARFEGN
ncbi:MAG TPA: enoyl-CoA hydratase-related protein [Burkholderiaceae bacterium]|nr:enoyl-CoA hydratase-related protein [Burkholderiaceae bacterium]